jgi:hypothetical protein
MVLESEWNRGLLVQKEAHVDGDFQKLVQARADVRVWISACHNTDIAEKHLVSCKEQIKRFSGTDPDDNYIFIIHDRSQSATKVSVLKASELTGAGVLSNPSTPDAPPGAKHVRVDQVRPA